MTRINQSTKSSAHAFAYAGLLAFGMSVSSLPAQAQFLSDETPAESAVPPPPSFNTQNLLFLDSGSFSNLRLGVDPSTLALTGDGVVRYVLVVVNASGTASALYEGIRCTTAETKLYGRFNAGPGWVMIKDPQWRSLYESGPSKHALKLARSGICTGAAANNSVQQMIKDLQGETKPL